MRLRLIHLYGDLMNLYGDRGNILALARRCAWRSIDLTIDEMSVGDRVDPGTSDIFFFGGGQDREQETVSGDLMAGNGNLLIASEIDGESHTTIGFENHSGQTYLGESVEPLGRVTVGSGNNGKDGLEGARYKGAIGTYLHGPALPKNPWLTDWLIRAALRRRFGTDVSLPALEDNREIEAHAAVEERVRREGNVHTSIR